MKKWWKSKTLWVNTISAALVVAEANFGVVREQLGPNAYLAGMATLAALNCFLRTLTTQPIKAPK
jgi:hypothetical protein